MINLRPATISDIESILRVHYVAVHGSATSTFYTQNILQSWSPSLTDERRLNQLHQAVQNNEELIVVAVSSENDMIVGFGPIIPLKQELRAVYVDPAFARRGVGTKILASLEELAVLHGADKLHMDASLNAERFYCHHGYSVIDRASHRLSSGIEMDCVKMSKELRAHK
jgi:GNAT superfamily N-acetyltransferase